ncbi:MAG TPA: murein biosynthesis integral membrane protein MurJ [Candidatus Limnocylindria bacterium]|nr:murein biosynthesis integral membrane protein MurJ [Candidatus Limnocylindria bacterium]
MTASTLARAGLIVAAAFFLSRVLGWVRLVVITNLLGASAELDAYFAAFRLPDTIYQLVAAGALSSALIPVLAGLYHRAEEERAWKVVSTVLNLMLLVLAGAAIVLAIFADDIVPIVTPGFDVVGIELTVRLTRLMLISPILLSLGAVALSVLNSRGRFGAAAMAPILYNLAIIVAAVALGPLLGVEALALGVVAGSFLHLAVQLPALIGQRFRYSFGIDLADSAARQVLLLLAPRTLGLGAIQITFLINTMLATGLGVGAVTAYNVAYTVMQIPLGLFVFPISAVLLPSMSHAIAAGALRDFGRLLIRSLRLLLYVMLFVTAVGIVLRRQVVTLLFDYGLDERALSLTSDTLSFFLLGTAGTSMVIVLARAFYSGHDTRTPVSTAIFEMIVSVVIAVATVGALGLSGIALGMTVGAWLEAGLLAFLLWRRVPSAGLQHLPGALITFLGGALLAGGAALAVVRLSDPLLGADPGKLALLGQVLIATAAAGLVYAAYTRLLGIPELGQTINLIRSVRRRSEPDPAEPDVSPQ